MLTKTCNVCKENKSLDLFGKNKRSKDRIHYVCKTCCKIKREKYKDISKEYFKLYKINNPEIIKRAARKHKKTEKYRSKEYPKNREYKKNNREKINATEKAWKENNPITKVAKNLRSRLRQFLYKNSFSKKKNLSQYLGLNKQEFKQYLEGKFTPEMNWDNYGSYWHIDHIIPLSSAKTVDELYKLNHYTNLQPLEAIMNIKKGNKICHMIS